MRKIKKYLIRIFGLTITYLFSYSPLSSHYLPMPEYGVETINSSIPYTIASKKSLTLWEKTVSVLLSPLILITIIVLAFSVGTAIYFLRKRKKKKNVKKNI